MSCDKDAKQPIEDKKQYKKETENMEEIKTQEGVLVLKAMPEFKAEAFNAATGHYVEVNSEDYKGKWTVVCFYPADFTFVCPTELEEMAEYYDKFQAENAEILSFSTDTEFSHLAWHQSSEAIGKIKFPMGADPTGRISKIMGTYIENEGLSLRGTFLINPEGKIVLLEINDNSIGRSASELLRKLQAAKYVAEHDGQVCPASWEPGKDTLEPNEDLVGKI